MQGWKRNGVPSSELCAMQGNAQTVCNEKIFSSGACGKKIFGFWRGQKIFRFCGWQKLTDVRRLKKECGVLVSVYIFFRFFRGARRKAKIPAMGQIRKIFLFF